MFQPLPGCFCAGAAKFLVTPKYPAVHWPGILIYLRRFSVAGENYWVQPPNTSLKVETILNDHHVRPKTEGDYAEIELRFLSLKLAKLCCQ